jgi:hypothetical protein
LDNSLIFSALEVPQTLAPIALAIWMPQAPTPPDAPLIRTDWPGFRCPLSRKACKAVHETVAREAASGKSTFFGLPAVSEGKT